MRPNRRPGNPGFETLLIGIGVVILVGQSLVAVVADYLPAFVILALAIVGAALIMSAALRHLEQRDTAGLDIDEARPAPLAEAVPPVSRAFLSYRSGRYDVDRLRGGSD